MKIIIDTNIYLNFYRLDGGQSLEMLYNLNKFIKRKKFKLILPQQIEDEFIRNKHSGNSIYGEHILNFQKGLDVEFKIPYLIKSSSKIEQIKKTVKRLKILKEKAVDDYKNRVFNSNSKINQQLNKLFSQALRPIETDVILQRAQFRTLRGNPPRKNNSSFGDAIIWETILDQCIDDDVTLISGDGDFESEINSGEMGELLIKEWNLKTDKTLTLYKNLGLFINKYSKKKQKPIKKETIEDEGRLNDMFNITNHIFSSAQNEGFAQVVSYDHSNFIGYNENNCTCCGAQVGSMNSLDAFGQIKCNNCRNTFMSGYTCNNCGRHYHRDDIMSINNGKCDECQDKL